MELVDKAAVVAEIERLSAYLDSLHEQRIIEKILYIIDTIEVKEVKEESEDKDLEEAISQSFIYHENHGDDFRSNKQIETAYRYGFVSGVKYKEKQNLEMKVVDLEKEIKNYLDKQPIVTRSKGIDYKLVPSPEVIAKHFFGLGLKIKKGEIYVVTRSEEHADYVECAFLSESKAEEYCKPYNQDENCYARNITKIKIQ